MRQTTDTKLVALAKEGDSDAFAGLVRRYGEAVKGFCYYRTGNFEDARDLCQETFIRAYVRLGQLREPDKIGAWLRQIAANLCNRWAHRQRELLLEEAETIPADSESPTTVLVRTALSGLPDKERLAVVMHYVDGLSYDEIAGFLQVSKATIRGRLYRGREMLKKEVLGMTRGAFGENRLDEKFVVETVELSRALLRAQYMEFQEIDVSPDDREAVVVFGNYDVPHDDYRLDIRNRSLWRLNLEDGSYTELAAAEEDARAQSWSPDGRRIAYVSRRSGEAQVWVMNRDGSDKRQITHCDFPASGPFFRTVIRWSPDGSKLAFTAAPNGSSYEIWTSRLWEAWKSAEQVEGRIIVGGPDTDYPKIARRLVQRLYEISVFVAEVETGSVKKLASSIGERPGIGLYQWFPDSNRVLVRIGEDVIAIDASTGEQTAMYTGPASLVRLETEGLYLARQVESRVEIGQVVEGVLKPEASVQLPETGISLLDWTHDRSTLFGTSRNGVSALVCAVEVPSSTVREVTEQGKFAASGGYGATILKCLHHERAVLFQYSGPSEPTEIWKYGPEEPLNKLSRFNDSLAGSDLGKTRIIDYKSGDWTIQAILVLPVGYKPGRRYPTLVCLRSWMGNMVNANFADMIDARGGSVAHWLAAHGYVVLLPNVRGSGGYGEEFRKQSDNRRQVNVPVADVLAGVDHLIAEGITDPEMLGIYGSFCGGMLTAWTITQTDRFKCATAGISSYDLLAVDRWESTGEEDNAQWLHPEIYKRFSPVENISSVKTPTLLFDTGGEWQRTHGALTPFYCGLRAMGVESYYVYYTRTNGSGGWNDDYKWDYMQRILAWFDHCLKGNPLPDWFGRTQHLAPDVLDDSSITPEGEAERQ